MPQEDTEKVRKRYFRRSSSKICDKKDKRVGDLQKCIDEANGYLQKIAELESNASKDVLAENCRHVDFRIKMNDPYENAAANLRRLDEALAFLCHIADIDIRAIYNQHTVSRYIDEANDYLLKIWKLNHFQNRSNDIYSGGLEDIKNVAQVLVASPAPPNHPVSDRIDMSEHDLDGLWDTFVRQRVEMNGAVHERQDTVPTLADRPDYHRDTTAVDDAASDSWDDFIAERAANITLDKSQKKQPKGRVMKMLRRLFGRK